MAKGAQALGREVENVLDTNTDNSILVPSGVKYRPTSPGLSFPHPTLESPTVAKGFGAQAAMDRESQNWDLRHIPPASSQILETKEIGLKGAPETSQF